MVKHSYEAGWFLPGGKVNYHESFRPAIVRELKEETGICVIGEPRIFGAYLHKILGATDYSVLFVMDSYSHINVKSQEIEEYRWFRYEEIPKTTSPGSKKRLMEYFHNLPPAEI